MATVEGVLEDRREHLLWILSAAEWRGKRIAIADPSAGLSHQR